MLLGQGRKYKLFKLLGFPIYAESSALFLLLLFVLMSAGTGAQGTIRGLVFAAVAFISIVFHEMGHALAIRGLGHGESEIVLHGLGGVCRWRGRATRRDRILIALAGPAAGLVLGGIAWLVWALVGPPGEFLLRAFMWAMLWINIVWSLFNLMPIWPLDGGHVVRYALAGRTSQRQSVALSLQVSMVAAGLLIAVGLMFREVFVVVLLGFILYNNYQEFQSLKGPPTSAYGR